jgi:hypothetical protein
MNSMAKKKAPAKTQAERLLELARKAKADAGKQTFARDAGKTTLSRNARKTAKGLIGG